MISERLTKTEGVYRIKKFIIKESKLIVSKQVGLIEVNKLIDSMKELHAQSDFSTDDDNFLIDLRHSVFSRNINKVRYFAGFMKANFSISLLNRIAFLTSESDQVAMAVVFKMLQDNQSRNMRVFSTLAHALIWLHVGMRVEQMKYYLE